MPGSTTCGSSATRPLTATALTYSFLDGTSMAAPHVTGAAALLFSLKPSATVTEVRDALLNGIDAVPSLTGKTTTGGRLDIAKAMDSPRRDARRPRFSAETSPRRHGAGSGIE